MGVITYHVSTQDAEWEPRKTGFNIASRQVAMHVGVSGAQHSRFRQVGFHKRTCGGFLSHGGVPNHPSHWAILA